MGGWLRVLVAVPSKLLRLYTIKDGLSIMTRLPQPAGIARCGSLASKKTRRSTRAFQRFAHPGSKASTNEISMSICDAEVLGLRRDCQNTPIIDKSGHKC